MDSGSHRHATAAVTLVLLLLIAMAVMVTWSRGRTRSTAAPSAISNPPVLTLVWRAVGRNAEPWSGVGLREAVRQELRSRGVTVTGDDRAPAKGTPETAENLASLGRALHATHVLAGTVGHKGERSEVGMRLVRVQDSAPVWASTFWRDPGDLGSLASDLAVVVAQVLETESLVTRKP